MAFREISLTTLNLDTILAELRDGLLLRQAAAAVLQRGEHLSQQCNAMVVMSSYSSQYRTVVHTLT